MSVVMRGQRIGDLSLELQRAGRTATAFVERGRSAGRTRIRHTNTRTPRLATLTQRGRVLRVGDWVLQEVDGNNWRTSASTILARICTDGSQCVRGIAAHADCVSGDTISEHGVAVFTNGVEHIRRVAVSAHTDAALMLDHWASVLNGKANDYLVRSVVVACGQATGAATFRRGTCSLQHLLLLLLLLLLNDDVARASLIGTYAMPSSSTTSK